MSQWTRELPNEAGEYWFCKNSRAHPRLLRVESTSPPINGVDYMTDDPGGRPVNDEEYEGGWWMRVPQREVPDPPPGYMTETDMRALVIHLSGMRNPTCGQGAAAIETLLDQRQKLRHCLLEGNGATTPQFLEWVADRMVHQYKENANVDFVLALRRKARKMREALEATS